MNASYQCGARAYLSRAKVQLDSGKRQSLFYAAFELRCAIESRLQEYLEVQEDVSKRKKNGWQIAKLAQDLEHAFRIGDQVVQLVFTDRRTSSEMAVYFTPIRRSLRERGERLGEYLHAMKRVREDDDPWWEKTRAFLADVHFDALFATAGTLLGPPMLKPGGRRFDLKIEMGVVPTQDHFFHSRGKAGFYFDMKVDYLAELPAAYMEMFRKLS